MSEILEAPAVPVSIAAVPANAAVPLSVTAAALDACIRAYRAEYAVHQANGKRDYECVKFASIAYRRALPTTETIADIQALIACVAQGINYQVYEGRESTQLLYAAQVALAAQKPPKPEKAKPQKPDAEK